MKPSPVLRVWDLPTRLFHWALVVSATGAFVTVKLGGLWMDWHVRFGLIVLGLIAFRIIWGVVGPRYARFGHFIRGPMTVVRFMRGQYDHGAGHNPLGALSVVALLSVFGFQAFSGLFADDDIFTVGPLAFLSTSWSATFTGLHKLNQWIMLALVALHVATIAWYQLALKRNLTGAMIHGDAQTPNDGSPVLPSNDSMAVRLSALLLAIAIGMVVWWLITLAPIGGDMSFM